MHNYTKFTLTLITLLILVSGCAVFNGTKPVPEGEVRFYVQEGDRHLSEGNYNEAIQSYSAAAKLDPQSIDVLAKLSEAYASQGKTDLALEQLAKIIDIDPKYISAYNYRGYIYYNQDKYAEAAAEFRAALKIEPENLYSLNYLGLVYKMLGRLDEAKETLQWAAELDPEMDTPDSRDTHNFLGLIYQDEGEYEKAIAEFRKTLEHFPEDATTYSYLGAALENSGSYLEAAEAYTNALKYDPSYTFAITRMNILRQSGWEVPPEPVEIVADASEDYISTAPEASEYPNSGVIILLDKFSYDFSDEGIARYTIHKIVKVLNDRGIQEYGEIAAPFNHKSQKVGVNIARTILADGKEVTAPLDAFHIITPPGLAEYNLYSDIRYHVVSMPALQPGAILEYKITVEDLESVTDMSWILGGMVFQWLDPVLTAKCVLRVPKDTQIKWKIYNGQIEPVITKDDDGRLTYIWISRNAPEFVPETAMPPLEEIMPFLMFSTAESWHDVYEWYKDLSEPQEMPDKNIKRKVAELVVGKATKAEKAKAIFEFVASEVRYVAIELGMGAYQPYSASEVFKNRYGDCKDKVTLLNTMLKEVNIESHPVLISPDPHRKVDTDLPSIGQFSHVIAAVKVDEGDYVWLDPTISTCGYGDLPAGDQGRKAFVIGEDSGEFVDTPVFPSEANKIASSSEIKLVDDGHIQGWERTTANGQADIYLRSVYRSIRPDRLRGFMADLLNPRYPGVKIDGVHLSDLYNMDIPVEVTVDFSCPGYVTGLEDMLIFPVPSEEFSAYAALVGESDRKHDLELGYNMAMERVLTLMLPQGYKVTDLPEDRSVEREFGAFTRKYETVSDSIVRYSVSLNIDIPVIPASKYSSFKNLVEAAAREDRAQIVLKKSSSAISP